jgi:hypothetical protein
MYWKTKIEKYGDKTFITYSYFKLISKSIPTAAFYNPFSKSITYPVKKELAVVTTVVTSEEDFLEFYEKNKEL